MITKLANDYLSMERQELLDHAAPILSKNYEARVKQDGKEFARDLSGLGAMVGGAIAGGATGRVKPLLAGAAVGALGGGALGGLSYKNEMGKKEERVNRALGSLGDEYDFSQGVLRGDYDDEDYIIESREFDDDLFSRETMNEGLGQRIKSDSFY